MQNKQHTGNLQQQRIAELIQARQYKAALKLAQKLADKSPQDPGLWYLVAGLHAETGNIEKVIACCQRVIRLNPEHAGACFNLATALTNTGKHQEALPFYRRSIEIDPGNTRALTGIGNVYKSLKDFDSARKYYTAAHDIEQKNPQHLINIGMSCSAEGNYSDARDFYNHALKINPESAEAHYYTGIAWQASGSLDKACDAYRRAIKIRPHYMEALNNLGHILSEQGNLIKAAEIFGSIISLYPESAEAHNNLGVVYDTMGNYAEAEHAYKTAIRLNPAFTQTLCHLGYMLADEGRTDEAVEYFDRATTLEPGLETALAGKAAALEKLGSIDAAFRIIEPVTAGGTDNLFAALAFCRIALRRGDLDRAIEVTTPLLTDGTPPSRIAAELNHVVGDIHERKADYEAAFMRHKLANSLSPITYDHEKHVDFINRIIEHITPGTLAAAPRAAHDFREIVFIVGMPRSGTSLIEQILASHPDVYGAGELPYMGEITRAENLAAGRKGAYPEALALLQQADVDALAQKYIQPVAQIIPDSRIVTDKMPHNFYALGLIALLFPRARIIHIKRSPLDNCLSLYFHHFNPMHSYSTDLRMLGKYYLQYERLMGHWKRSLDIPILEICYEEIVDNLESSTHRLLEFCGLPWSPDCLEFHKNERFVKTPSYHQVNRPIYTSSVGRWRNYRQHLGPLLELLGDRDAP